MTEVFAFHSGSRMSHALMCAPGHYKYGSFLLASTKNRIGESTPLAKPTYWGDFHVDSELDCHGSVSFA